MKYKVRRNSPRLLPVKLLVDVLDIDEDDVLLVGRLNESVGAVHARAHVLLRLLRLLLGVLTGVLELINHSKIRNNQ